MRLPKWNPEGFWRSLSPNNQHALRADAALERGEATDTPPVAALAGRRRAKQLRRMLELERSRG